MMLTLANPKTLKGIKSGWVTGILMLAPGKVSGKEVCPARTAACFKHCLFLQGRGRIKAVRSARIRKTRLFFEDREKFANLLNRDITRIVKLAKKQEMRAAIRLNGLSDLDWVKLLPGLFEKWSDVQFYDYTKVFPRMKDFLASKLPANYHLTFSWSGTNVAKCWQVIEAGGNVAVPMESMSLTPFEDVEVIDGDEDDLRFEDPSPVVIRLKPKGSLIKAKTKFKVSM